MEQPHLQILSLSDVRPSLDGTALAFTLETSGGKFPLCCPAVDIGEFLAFFGHAAAAIGATVDEPNTPKNDLVPIPATGIGFQAGQTPDTTLFVVNVSGFGMAFEVPSSGLADMAERLGQIARTLSASSGKPQ